MRTLLDVLRSNTASTRSIRLGNHASMSTIALSRTH
jgi:hypothetical protein